MRVILILSLFIQLTASVVLAGEINLDHWKISLPIASKKGNALEVYSSDLKNYLETSSSSISKLSDYFYSSEEGLVFHAMYTGVTTSSDTKYSRTEFREMDGENERNWVLGKTRSLKCRLKVTELMGNANKIIFMQIHGVEPSSKPLIKCLWEKGKIKIITKSGPSLKDLKRKPSYANISLNSWFTCEIIANEERIDIKVNDQIVETFTREDVLKFWPDGNTYFFKAGNYLQHNVKEAGATIIFSDIKLTH